MMHVKRNLQTEKCSGQNKLRKGSFLLLLVPCLRQLFHPALPEQEDEKKALKAPDN
jgi:mannose/fructose/N-acetylgalactosamine-specific phosphotransferase system component IID